jgi:hypothetical protein
MSQFTRMAAATVAIGLVLAVPAANARPIDDPAIRTSSLAGTVSDDAPKQNLRGADAQGVPTAPKWEPLPPVFPTYVTPDVPAPTPAPAKPAVSADDGTSPLVYILPAAGLALMFGAALVYVRPRRARVSA